MITSAVLISVRIQVERLISVHSAAEHVVREKIDDNSEQRGPAQVADICPEIERLFGVLWLIIQIW